VDELRRLLDEASLEKINARLVRERKQAAEDKRLRRERKRQEKAAAKLEGEEPQQGEADKDDGEREGGDGDGGDGGDDDDEKNALPEPAELMELSNQQLEEVHAEIDRRKEALVAANAAEDEEQRQSTAAAHVVAHDQGVVQRVAAAERRQKREAKLRYLDLLGDICNLRIQVLAYRYSLFPLALACGVCVSCGRVSDGVRSLQKRAIAGTRQAQGREGEPQVCVDRTLN
jgi:hypothetical protein